MSKPVVIIVDDDEDMLTSVRIVLSRKYTVFTANSAAKALDLIQSTPAAAIVLDIKMPDQDGFWIFRHVRAFNTSVPIIFNSAYQDIVPPEDINGAFAPFAYLTKNGNLSDFLRVVAEAVAKP